MNQHRKMAALDRIAQMKRELELAELARLQARRRYLAEETERIRQQSKAAAHAGTASAVEGRAAEQFGRWAIGQQAVLAQEDHRLSGAVSVQKGRAALAVGRQDVLERIVAQLKESDLRARTRK